MAFVDIHAHLDYDSFDLDREHLVNLMEKEKIQVFSNTVSYENYLYTKSLFKNNKNIFVCPGLYPQNAEVISDDDFDKYLNFLRTNANEFLAIGEVGLDKYHTKDEDLFQIQINRFKSLIELGIELNKPLIVHTRSAEKIVLDIVEYYVNTYNFRKFDLHCFMGKKKLIKKIISLKIYCSIPMILLNNSSFQYLVEQLPIRYILTETDSPFLHPQKERNSSLNIPIIIKKIAEIKGLDEKEVENILYLNYLKFIN